MQLTVLGSGSKGNASILKYNETTLLLDSGFSLREVLKRIQHTGMSAEQLDAIVLTHYHSDHISSAAMLARHYKIPVYCTEETFPYVYKRARGYSNINLFQSSFTIKELQITPIAVPHDANGTVSLFIQGNKHTFILATDMGEIPEDLTYYLKRSQTWLLESNHDREMLKYSSYPQPLKIRVASNLGHLSNYQAFKAVRSFSGNDTTAIVLGHISQENNSPDLIIKKINDHKSNELFYPEFFIADQYNILPSINW